MGGINIFPSEICCLIVSKLLVVESFVVCLISGVMSRPSVEYFLSRSTGRFCRGTILCCSSENFLDKIGGGVSRYCRRKFLSHSAEVLRKGNH